MRVLCKKDSNSLKTIEIMDIGFEDDITAIKDSDGNHDNFLETPMYGLYMRDTNGDFLYIEGLLLETCSQICKTILQMGYFDLSKYSIKTLDEIYEEDCMESYAANKGDIVPYAVLHLKQV